MSIVIMNAADTTVVIERIRVTGESLHADMHNAAVSCLSHIREHGDTTLATRLLTAMPGSSRREALVFWFAKYSNNKVKLAADKHGVWSCKLDNKRSKEDFDIDAAMTMHFADLTKEKKPKTLELTDLLKMLKGIADKDGVFQGTTIPKASDAARRFAAIALETVKEQAHIA